MPKPSETVFFWEVDAQRDFLLPGGKLYVPGAEKRIPNMQRLVGAARAGEVLLLSDACVHRPDDPEFTQFPPHCVRGTEGAEILPQLIAEPVVHIPSQSGAQLPKDLFAYHQIVLEKQVLDVFSNPHATELLDRLTLTLAGRRQPQFFVFGVVTEYCVRLAAKGLLERGKRTAVVTDAIETLDSAAGNRALEELAGLGARLVSTDQALDSLAETEGSTR